MSCLRLVRLRGTPASSPSEGRFLFCVLVDTRRSFVPPYPRHPDCETEAQRCNVYHHAFPLEVSTKGSISPVHVLPRIGFAAIASQLGTQSCPGLLAIHGVPRQAFVVGTGHGLLPSAATRTGPVGLGHMRAMWYR